MKQTNICFIWFFQVKNCVSIQNKNTVPTSFTFSPRKKRHEFIVRHSWLTQLDGPQGRERLDQWHDGGISMCTRLCWSTVWVPQNLLVIFEDAWKVTWYKKNHQILLVVLSNIRWTSFPMLYKDMAFHDPVSIYGPIFCCKLFHDMAPDWEPTHGGERRN